VGGSQGGLISILTALWYPDLIHGARISGAILETVQPDQYHVGRSQFEEANQGSRLGIQKLYPIIASAAFADEDEWIQRWNQVLPVSYARHLQRPIVMFAGDEDQFVPPEYDRFFEELNRAGKRHLVKYYKVPRAGHGESHRGTYIEAVEDLMQRAAAQADRVVTRPPRRVEGPLLPLPFQSEPRPELEAAGAEPELLRVTSHIGQGSWLGEFNALKVIDIDGDGHNEIVFGNLEGFVTALRLTDDDRLVKVWQSPDLGDSIAGLAVADLDGDGDMEIIAGNEQGTLFVFDGNTKELVWTSTRLGEACFNLRVAEPYRDGAMFIFVATRDGYLYQLDGATRDVVWKSPRIDGVQHALMLEQLDQDDQLEIVVGTVRGDLFVFDSKTHEQEWQPWETPALSVQAWNVVSTNLDDDPQAELIVAGGIAYPRRVVGRQEHGSYGGIYLIDAKSKQVEAKFDQCNSIYGLAVQDVNGDGRSDVLMAGESGQIWSLLAGAPELVELTKSPGARITGLAVGRLREDAPPKLVVTTFHGDVRVHDVRPDVPLVSELRGLGGAYGLAIRPAEAHQSAEVYVSCASGYIYRFDGLSQDFHAWQTPSGSWSNPRGRRWYHALALAPQRLFAATGLGWYSGGGGGLYEFDRSNRQVLGGGRRTELPGGSGSTRRYPSGFDYTTWGLAAGDLDGDGSIEIVSGDEEGFLEVRSSGSMERLYRSWDFGHDVNGIRILDVDGDGTQDILAGMRGGFVHLIDTSTFQEKWISDDLGWHTWGIDAADVDGDGACEVVVGTQREGLFILDGRTGDVKGQRHGLGRHLYGVKCSDVDRDGNLEILVGSGAGYLWVLDGKTRDLRWRSPGLGNFLGAYNSLDVVALNGDAAPDIVCGGSGYVTVLQRSRDQVEPSP
jgi:outer membrane protein assembly factor BamB